MKAHTPKEEAEAKKNLPQPVADLLESPALVEMYTAIQKKNALDLRQLGAIVAIVNATLLGLEPESSIEKNLRQALPELSKDKTQAVVSDINQYVFEEARERLGAYMLKQKEAGN